MNKKTGIIGYGVLGKAYAKALGVEMYIDPVGSSISFSEMCKRVKWILICVPTPPTSAGDCDTSIVEDWVKKISEEKRDNYIVIKSTVIPGTALRLMKKYKVRIVSAPEFLTEATAEEDAKFPDLEVIGTKEGALAEKYYRYQKKVRSGKYYRPYLVITDNTTAEFIKYSINSFYATKVTFANEIYNSAVKHRVNYESVVDAMYHRKWIGNNHLSIFHKGKRGYAGKCLPKDTLAFSRFTRSPLLVLVNKINKGLVAKNSINKWKKILNGIDPNHI